MRVTIRGIRYDTETARLVGGAHHLTGPSWLRWSASLYRTPRRPYRYFLAGAGGALTRFGNGQIAGDVMTDRIIPLTEAEARAFAQAFLRDWEGAF